MLFRCGVHRWWRGVRGSSPALGPTQIIGGERCLAGVAYVTVFEEGDDLVQREILLARKVDRGQCALQERPFLSKVDELVEETVLLEELFVLLLTAIALRFRGHGRGVEHVVRVLASQLERLIGGKEYLSGEFGIERVRVAIELHETLLQSTELERARERERESEETMTMRARVRQTDFGQTAILDVGVDVLAGFENSIDDVIDELLGLIVGVLRLLVDERDDFCDALPTVVGHLFGDRLHVVEQRLAVAEKAEVAVVLVTVPADDFAG